MPGRPSKPVDLMLLTGTKHLTKDEIEQRKKAEAALITGKRMEMWPEVKKNRRAASEFKRVCDLLGIIQKDDALHEGVVNRYCLLRAECVEFEEKRETFYKGIKQLEKEYKNQKVTVDEETGRNVYDISPSQYYKLLRDMQSNIIALDKQIMVKRNMMLAIEKENLMTIASALRSIPKKVENKKEKLNGVAAFKAKRAEEK